jgi:hypothetical protein
VSRFRKLLRVAWLMRGVVGMRRQSRSLTDSDWRSGSFSPAFELGGQEEDRMSPGARLTWETCPRCGLSAAVGWRDGALVAVDCPGGCRLTAAHFTRRRGKGLRFRPLVAPEPTVGRVARATAGPTLSTLRSDR